MYKVATSTRPRIICHMDHVHMYSLKIFTPSFILIKGPRHSGNNYIPGTVRENSHVSLAAGAQPTEGSYNSIYVIFPFTCGEAILSVNPLCSYYTK